MNALELIERQHRELRQRLAQWLGAQFYTVYEINDSAANAPLSRYGVRKVDGTWKPVVNLPLLLK